MGNWVKETEKNKELKEKRKVRKEKLASFFFNLAQLTFTVLVLGAAASFFQNFNVTEGVIYMAITGSITVITFAKIGNNLLK